MLFLSFCGMPWCRSNHPSGDGQQTRPQAVLLHIAFSLSDENFGLNAHWEPDMI
jgi:hypothetical protein